MNQKILQFFFNCADFSNTIYTTFLEYIKTKKQKRNNLNHVSKKKYSIYLKFNFKFFLYLFDKI